MAAGVKVATKVAITYDSFSLDPYLNQASIEITVEQAKLTNFDSTGDESMPTLPATHVPIQGPWGKALDDKLAPDALTPPDAASLLTLVVEITAPDGTITYTATTAAYIANYRVQFDSPAGIIMWTGDLIISGVPVRA